MILRRVDDSFCDPLELRGDSLLGVPGLVDAIVAGNVKVANALGSGLIETAAIMPFLPGLCTTIAWREAQTSVSRDLVVRADVRARLGAQPSRLRGGETGVSLTRYGTGLWGRTPARREGQVCRAIAGPPARVCGAGAGRFVHCAGVGQRMSQLAQRGAAHLRAQYRQRVDCDSGRTGTCCRSGRIGRLDAAGRPQQGRMGSVGQPRRYVQYAASAE